MHEIEKINISDGLETISEYWRPVTITKVNDTLVKLVKFKGEFVLHAHENEDELFIVVKGEIKVRFPGKIVTVSEGEMITIPQGVEHCPSAEQEAHVMLIEPAATEQYGTAR